MTARPSVEAIDWQRVHVVHLRRRAEKLRELSWQTAHEYAALLDRGLEPEIAADDVRSICTCWAELLPTETCPDTPFVHSGSLATGARVTPRPPSPKRRASFDHWTSMLW